MWIFWIVGHGKSFATCIYNLIKVIKNCHISVWMTLLFFPPLHIKPLPPRGLGGVCTSEGIFVDDTHLQAGDGGFYPYEICATDDSVAVYMGFLFGVWGHIITDDLKFLWFLHSDSYKALKDKYGKLKLVYICEPWFDIHKVFSELLSLADIDGSEFVKIDKVTKFKQVIVPEPSFFLAGFYRYYTSGYKDIIQRIVSKVHPIVNDKVYLTRTRLHDKRDFGEKNVEKAFKKKGYKIIAPERLTLKEQLAVYKGARLIAVTEGSISHNAVFMSEGVSLILLRKANFFNTYQEPLNDINHLSVTYIDAHLSCFTDAKAPWTGPFFMYCNDNLSAFLNCKKNFPIFLFFYYIFKCFRLKNVAQRMLSDKGLYVKLGNEFTQYLTPFQKIKLVVKRILRR